MPDTYRDHHLRAMMLMDANKIEAWRTDKIIKEFGKSKIGELTRAQCDRMVDILGCDQKKNRAEYDRRRRAV